MTLKEKLTNFLQAQLSQGQDILSRVNSAQSPDEMNVIFQDYNNWDEINRLLLEKGFDTNQFINNYQTSLDNVFLKEDTFSNLRKRISQGIDGKSRKILMVLERLKILENKDLLPFSDPNHLLKTKTPQQMKKVFISHAYTDHSIVNHLVDLLRTIGLNRDQIFYSSDPAYGVKPGENILDRLKNELNSTDLVLFILSGNFYKSAACLCEMGAAWVKTTSHIPVLIPPFTYKDIDGAIPKTALSLTINDNAGINSLKDSIEKEFNLLPIHVNTWDVKKAEYMNKLKALGL